MTKFVGLRGKTYGSLTDDGSEHKKAKDTKKCVIKGKLEFENYKNCLEATQLDNKMKYLEKKVSINSLLKNHEKFIGNNKSLLKTQQRFKNESHKVTKEINEIALSSDDDKRMQPFDSMEA